MHFSHGCSYITSIPSRWFCGMVAVRVHVFLHCLCSSFSVPVKLRCTKSCKPPPSAFPQAVVVQGPSTLGEGCWGIFACDQQEKNLLSAQSFWENNSISGHFLPLLLCLWCGWTGEREAPPVSRCLHQGRQQNSQLGLPWPSLCSVCNALSLTMFGLLSVRVFIVPILLPL